MDVRLAGLGVRLILGQFMRFASKDVRGEKSPERSKCRD
jgi:hypothetical protein